MLVLICQSCGGDFRISGRVCSTTRVIYLAGKERDFAHTCIYLEHQQNDGYYEFHSILVLKARKIMRLVWYIHHVDCGTPELKS